MISSARRTMSILETIGRADGPMGVTDIARRLDLQPGTVFRGLNALEQSGYISRFQASSRYVLGPAVNQLRQSLLARFKIRGVCLPYLRQLAFATGETVSLIMMVGWHGLRLAAAPGTSEVTSSPPIGQLRALHQTCGGRAILAFLPDSKLQDYRRWSRGTEGARYPKTLSEDLRTARKRGFAVEATTFAPDRASAAFPIHGEAMAIAAVAIEGPVLQLDNPTGVERWIEIVQSLQRVIDVAPREFAGPFAHVDPGSSALSSA
jgi:DNA-binding IclR family transcriptional regulator